MLKRAGIAVAIALVVLGAWGLRRVLLAPDSPDPAPAVSSGGRASRVPLAAPPPAGAGRPSLRGTVVDGAGPVPGVEVVATSRRDWPAVEELPCPCEGCAGKMLEEGCDTADAAQALAELAEELRQASPAFLRAVTDAQGRFELDGLEAGPYDLWASGARGVAARPGVLAGAGEVRLSLEVGLALTARVEGLDALPLAGVEVTAFPLQGGRPLSARSGADGVATFGHVPRGSYAAVATAPGLLPANDTLRGSATLTLRLLPPRALSGLVLRGDEAVPGATVRALDGDKTLEAVTDGQGRFSFTRLRADQYQVEARKGGEHAIARVSLPHSRDLRDVPLQLEPCGELSGRVLDAGGGPIRGADIRGLVIRGRVFDSQRTSTDGEGRYRFECVLAGTATLLASAPGFQPRPASPFEQELSSGGSLAVDFTLEAAAVLRGHVVDPRGRGIAGAHVGLRQVEPDSPPSHDDIGCCDSLAGEAISDGEGRFEFDGLGPGTYVYVATPHGGHRGARGRTRTPEADLRVVLEPEAPGVGAIAGEVVDEAGVPQSGAELSIEGADEAHCASPAAGLPTDALGRFRFEGCGVGTYTVKATLEGEGGARSAATSAEVRGSGDVPVRLVVQEGESISGQVVDGEGRPMPGAFVLARKSGIGEWLDADERGALGYVRTDAQGRFQLRHLAAGTFEVEARKVEPRGGRVDAFALSPALENYLLPPTEEDWLPAKALVRTGEGPLTLVLHPAPVVRGRVLRAGGAPVRGFTLNGLQVLDSGGRFHLRRDLLDDRPLVVVAPGLGMAIRSLPPGDGRDLELPDIVLGDGQGVSGQVVDAVSGQPLEGAQVDPLDMPPVIGAGERPWRVRTGADGRFTLPPSEGGVTELVVSREGYNPERVPVAPGSGPLTVQLVSTEVFGHRGRGRD